MVFGDDVTAESRIATFKAKWSVRYRESRDIQNMVAKNLSADVRKRLAEVAVRAYQAAGLHDYGRIDVRLAHDDAIYVVEANPNPISPKARTWRGRPRRADTRIRISLKRSPRWQLAATRRAADSLPGDAHLWFNCRHAYSQDACPVGSSLERADRAGSRSSVAPIAMC
jgi:hypothetical protein